MYHDLVISLKAQLEQQAAVDEDHVQGLVDLEESLASESTCGSGVGVDAASSASGASCSQPTWTGEAYGGLVYESVDELRVALESLQVYRPKKNHYRLREKISMTGWFQQVVNLAVVAIYYLHAHVHHAFRKITYSWTVHHCHHKQVAIPAVHPLILIPRMLSSSSVIRPSLNGGVSIPATRITRSIFIKS